METTFWPRVRAQRAFCAAEILARAAALIVRRPRVAPVLFNPQSLDRGIQSVDLLCCLVPLSLQLRDYVHVFASGEDCSRYSKLRGSLQREQHAQCVVSAAIDLPAIASYHSLTDGHAVTTRRADRLALPHRRKARRRRHGRGL